MAGSLISRSTHYDVLGLAATAEEGDIARAFAAKMSPFVAHAPGEAARICAAYETLRDPARRRDYDRSIELTPKPEPRHWGFAVTNASWPGFVGSAASAEAVDPPTTPASAEPLVEAQPAETSPELERASAIAASLRRLAEPAAFDPPPRPAAEPRQRPIARPDPVAPTDLYRIFDTTPATVRLSADEQPFDWRRPTMVVGGLIAAAGLIGAFAGLSVKDDAASAAAPAVTIPLPAAKQVAETAPPLVAAPVELARAAPAAVPRQIPSKSHMIRATERAVPAAQPQELELAATQAVAETAPAEPIAAKLPLPDPVVARTIERIGYACGKVTATVAGASAGVYQVTCSSGDTYQATPVQGRYRFRRSH
jgi:hypothetical protein